MLLAVAQDAAQFAVEMLVPAVAVVVGHRAVQQFDGLYFVADRVVVAAAATVDAAVATIDFAIAAVAEQL